MKTSRQVFSVTLLFGVVLALSSCGASSDKTNDEGPDESWVSGESVGAPADPGALSAEPVEVNQCSAAGSCVPHAGNCCSGTAQYGKPGCSSYRCCWYNGATTTSANLCCSGLAAYNGSSLTCVACIPIGSITPSASSCCTGHSKWQGSNQVCCLYNGAITSSASRCCSGNAAYAGSNLTCVP